MKDVMIHIFFVIVAIAAIIGIKITDLPVGITVLLLPIIILVAIFGMVGGFSIKTFLKKRTEEKESSIHQTVLTQTEKL